MSRLKRESEGRAGRAEATGGRRRLALALAGLPLLAGCVALPEDGPVRAVPEQAREDEPGGASFVPRPPRRGESQREIVAHFFEAMMAVPTQTATAELFLSADAREEWRPMQRMITYSGTPTPVGDTDVVVLEDAHWLDAGGSWQGALPEAESRIRLPMSLEEGEWRISEVPDALVVPEAWFREHYEQVSLYFFDPSAQILVPEPVFLPRRGQLATLLVQGLLRGPSGRVAGSVASFFPAGIELDDISVPVDESGVAQVALSGGQGTIDPKSQELVMAQLAWTLRQDPRVRRFRVTVGGTPVSLPGGASEVPVTTGEEFDPAGPRPGLFALREGAVVRITADGTSSVDGPFGAAVGVRDVAVDPSGATVAAVSFDGRRLLVGPVDLEPAEVVTVPFTSGTDLGNLSWDALGRLWFLDRTPQGAAVWVYDDRRLTRVEVPGVTGGRVADLLVSRDGSRLVAALDRVVGDLVVASRLAWSARGVTAGAAQPIASGENRSMLVRDLGWSSPTELLVLTSLGQSLSEVRRVSVDGSPATRAGSASSEVIRDDCVTIVSSPSADSAAWVTTTQGGLVQLAPLVTAPDVPEGVTDIGYAG